MNEIKRLSDYWWYEFVLPYDPDRPRYREPDEAELLGRILDQCEEGYEEWDFGIMAQEYMKLCGIYDRTASLRDMVENLATVRLLANEFIARCHPEPPGQDDQIDQAG